LQLEPKEGVKVALGETYYRGDPDFSRIARSTMMRGQVDTMETTTPTTMTPQTITSPVQHEVEPSSSWVDAKTVEQREAVGRALRTTTPRSSHALWTPPADRADPIDLLEAQPATRLPELVPIRYGRMLTSPFAFLRGSAAVMAHDLASMPTTGLTVQLCGDCHLANFGIYASPERKLVFDINDFDETLPGPWEWDLKRLATSFHVATHTFGLSRAAARDVVLHLVETYRTHLRAFAE
jgi:hypothetical protein